jgi:hypothetical protein
MALRILPALMHEVHTRMRRLPVAVATRTACKFGNHRRLVWRWEWLTLQPVDGFLPQILHILDIMIVPLNHDTPNGAWRIVSGTV